MEGAMIAADRLTATDAGGQPQLGLEGLLNELESVRTRVLDQASSLQEQIAAVLPLYRESALNLAHYLGLRQHDLRPLQEALADAGLSSLGRCEGHALAGIDAVLRAGTALMGRTGAAANSCLPPVASAAAGRARLAAHTADLLGPEPAMRRVRIMVTLPAEAAGDYALVRDLVASGMDCARTNCAHDDLGAWRQMAANVRRAANELGRPCRVLVDLAGPKLRTGDLPPGPAVVRLRPRRDQFGALLEPAHVWLTPRDQPGATPGQADAVIPVQAVWLAQVRVGDTLKLRDLRGKRRSLIVTEVRPDGCRAEAEQTAYVGPSTRLRIARRGETPPQKRGVKLCGLPASPGTLVLRPGDTLIMTTSLVPSAPTSAGDRTDRIACSLPGDIATLRSGEPVWFDDGKIGGRIRHVTADGVEVEITQAKPTGSKLRADRSVNLPESQLERPPVTSKDIEDLAFVAESADMVGLSFAESPLGIQQVADALRQHTTRPIGIVLKIETRHGFEHLPQLLLAAMRHRPIGVMIARGDLAVECGYERLAEVQEEMLWLCEAAHLPVIWATQVLDQLTRTGQPSRAEISDAAMAERAECVMLNKGPHVVAAVRALGDILVRMQTHQDKKRSLFRRLRVSAVNDYE
jgi:pyruvate kinase